MFLFSLLLLIYSATANNIVNNIPTVVTNNKNYSTAEPVWLTSPYMRANNEAVISTKTGSDQYPFSSYTFIYSSPLPGVPNLAYGIQRYRGDDTFIQEFYEIRQTGRTATSFSVEIQIFGYTNIWIMAVAYLAVDPTFPHHLNSFDNVPVNYTAGDIVNITSQVADMRYYSNTINYTAQAAGSSFTQFTTPYSSNYIVIFMTSLWIRAYSSMPVQFHIYPEVINQTHYKWNVTLYHYVKITNVHFSQIIFNSDDVQSSEKYFIVNSKWYTDINGGFFPIPIQFVDNFIMGITSFEAVQGRCAHQYQWQFANKTVDGVETFGVQILYSWAVFDRCGLSWCESTIFYMMTWQCEAPYYYFNLTSGLCQTLCGGFTFQNEATYTCDPCGDNTCYQCDTSNTNTCTECATYLHYELSTGKCVCSPSYFPSNSSCMSCDFGSTGCLNCTYDDGSQGSLPYNSALFTCTQCNNTANYFLSSGLCSLCTLSNCITCQDLTKCALCKADYDYSDAQTCIKCLVTGCKNCSASNDNICTTCDNSIGYYKSGNICVPQCGDGIIISASEQCDDNNTDNYDGCSSTCNLESSFSCSGSPSSCSFQPSVVVALSSQDLSTSPCNHIIFKFSITPASDTFAQSNINWDGFLVTPNSSLLEVNATLFDYTSGVLSASYFLLSDLEGKSLTFSFDYSVLLVNSSIFSGTTSPPISFTVSTTPAANMFCCDGYEIAFNPTRCKQTCGDGRVFQDACDDNNTYSGDGCSSVCTIQSDYICSGQSTTQPSVCRYNGSYDLAVQRGDKSPTSNSLVMTYSLAPAQPWLALNNRSSDATSLVSFPGTSGVTVTSATIDPATNQLIVNLDYSEDIQGRDLTLFLTPPSTPQASLTPTMTSPWTVNPTNQLAAIFYSQQDYQAVDKLTPLAIAILCAYLAVVLASLGFRKFIGLELATLVQFGYLSLLSNAEKTPYVTPIYNWNSVFGYNQLHFSQPPNQPISLPHATYGYESHFGFTNNVMNIATASVYVLAVLTYLSSNLFSKVNSRKLKSVSSVMASDIGYALLVFCTPNIITSLAIQSSQGTILDTSIPWSKGLLIGTLVLMLGAHIASIVKARQSSDVGTFFRKHSRLGIYAPVIFNFRLIAITSLLFAYHFSKDVPSYLIAITQCAYVLFVLIGKPHKRSFDTVRSLFIEVGLLYVLVIRYVEIEVFRQSMESSDITFPTIAYVEYGVYGLASTLSTISLVYHIFKECQHSKAQAQVFDEPPIDKNDSMAKMQDNASKKTSGSNNPLVFDIEDVDIPQSSNMSLDSPKKPRKGRRRK